MISRARNGAGPETIAPPAIRWWRYVRRGRVVCPNGHHIPNTFDVTEAGFVRCGHRAGGRGEERKPECGAWMFLYAVRGGGLVAAAVTLSELPALRALSTPAEMLAQLEIWPDA